MSEQGPSGILTTLNTVLCNDSERFCTVALVCLSEDEDGWTATVSCAVTRGRSWCGRVYPRSRSARPGSCWGCAGT